MATRDRPTFEEMCRAFPIRTGLFTFGPLLVGAAQSLNAVAHGTNLWLVAFIAVVTVAYSILVTNYHLASFRRRTVCRGIE
jgi:urea transporter